MAFNPFHSFRKHQKAIFAVLTIMCMLVFVLQFGRGDMFERMAGLFGSSRGKGDVVATLYGKKVTTGELTGPKGAPRAAANGQPVHGILCMAPAIEAGD